MTIACPIGGLPLSAFSLSFRRKDALSFGLSFVPSVPLLPADLFLLLVLHIVVHFQNCLVQVIHVAVDHVDFGGNFFPVSHEYSFPKYQLGWDGGASARHYFNGCPTSQSIDQSMVQGVCYHRQ